MTPKEQQRANRVVWFEIPVAGTEGNTVGLHAIS
jgi:hypothetical protein